MPLRGLDSLLRLTQSPKKKSRGLPSANELRSAPNPEPKCLDAPAPTASSSNERLNASTSSQDEGTMMSLSEKSAASERATLDEELRRLRKEVHELRRLRELDLKEREAERAEQNRLLEEKGRELQRVLEEARKRDSSGQQINEWESSDTVRIVAYTADVSRKFYFGSGALRKTDLASYLSVHLEADGRNQGWASDPEAGIRSWFELAILSSVPKTGQSVDEQIKVVDGKRCTWVSHVLPLTRNYVRQTGQLFQRSHEIWSYIDDGDIIGVLACAQSPGWKCEARHGKLNFKRVDSVNDCLHLTLGSA